MKLLCHDSEKTAMERKKLVQKIESSPYGLTPEKVIIDFLAALRVAAERAIELSEYRECEKKFTLGVPAAWTDIELQGFVTLAKKAGITSPTLVSEPEAATSAILHHSSCYGLQV